jgi:hypothetical protein
MCVCLYIRSFLLAYIKLIVTRLWPAVSKPTSLLHFWPYKPKNLFETYTVRAISPKHTCQRWPGTFPNMTEKNLEIVYSKMLEVMPMHSRSNMRNTRLWGCVDKIRAFWAVEDRNWRALNKITDNTSNNNNKWHYYMNVSSTTVSNLFFAHQRS